MATTKLHSIKQTVGKAIDYICNPDKTENCLLVSTYACSQISASIEFEATRRKFNSDSINLARHCIQSFAPGEVTPEQAHEIGVQLADELLHGQYEYVLATHIDRGHIHNHLIINETNFVTGRSFSTEHDQYKCPAWKQLRKISDELCKENHLSIIQNAERGIGKSYFEWGHSKANTSWKDLLKETIDSCIMEAESFEDFLRRMQEHEYEYKLRGDTLSFKAKGQERFTRCRRKTLGWYYEPEQLRTRIERSIRRRNAPIQNRNGFVSVRNSNDSNIGLQRWAMLKNMQEASELINTLTELNCRSPQDIKDKIMAEHDVRFSIVDKMNAIDESIKEKNLKIKNIHNYWKYKPINDKYKSSFNKNRFYSQHEDEIKLFRSAKAELKKTIPGKVLPREETVQKELNQLTAEREKLYGDYKNSMSTIDTLEKTLSKLEAFYEQQREAPNKTKSDELE